MAVPGIGYSPATPDSSTRRYYLAQFADPGAAAAAWRLLLMLAVPSATGAGFVRSAVSLAGIPELRSVAGHLARDRLVVIGHRPDGVELVELAHQALIDNWPRLRDRLECDREFRLWLPTGDVVAGCRPPGQSANPRPPTAHRRGAGLR